MNTEYRVLSTEYCRSSATHKLKAVCKKNIINKLSKRLVVPPHPTCLCTYVFVIAGNKDYVGECPSSAPSSPSIPPGLTIGEIHNNEAHITRNPLRGSKCNCPLHTYNKKKKYMYTASMIDCRKHFIYCFTFYYIIFLCHIHFILFFNIYLNY